MKSGDMLIIDVAKEFSAKPFGRYEADSDRSAEAFRKKFLIPALQAGKPFVVDLSGSNRYSSSFLEEAFGGLIREGIAKDKLSLMTVKHDLLPSIVEEVQIYIDRAGD